MLLSAEKVLSKMPTFFSLPKRESFWLAGFQSLADPAASKAPLGPAPICLLLSNTWKLSCGHSPFW